VVSSERLDARCVIGVESSLTGRTRKIAHLAGTSAEKDKVDAASALLESRVCSWWAELVVHEETKAKRYYVSGVVQGVGFRYFVERAAKYLKIRGFTRNLLDGRVEVYAIAPADALAALRRDLERGPQGALVTSVAEEEARIEPKYADRFSIEYDA
jgi:acylphosphatase